MRFRSGLSFLTVALTTLLASCGDDGGTPPVQTPTVSVAATTSSATISRGGTATYPISITRGGGYTGAVTLSAENLPSDVSATFAPTTLPNGTTASTLSLTAGGNAAPATSTVTVRASGAGVTAATTTVTLTVSAPASITLAAGSNTATAVQGATTTIPLNITRTNFTGDVAIAISGLPAGVTATLNPASPLGNGVTATTLTLTAAANAATGTTNNVVITASGAGVTAQTQTISLTINPSTAPGFTLTAAPAAVTATAGAGGTSTVTLGRQGGFTGDVALTVTGAPTGVTATLSPTTLSGTATTSTLTLASTAATVPGTYNIVVRGNSAGQTERTATVAFTVNAAPGVTVAVAPGALTLAAGSTATSAITVGRTGGLTGDIALTVEGAPAGLTVAFAPTPVTGTNTTSGLTVTTGANVVAGTYNLIIRGTGPGNVSGTAPLAVTVTAAQGLTVAATGATAAPGATGTSNITLTRIGGYAGNVTLTVAGLPAGVTATFNPASTTGLTSQLSLQVPGTVAPGTYTGTITAAGTGVTSATTSVTLVVTGGSAGGNVAFRYCDVTDIPSFLAYRNGTTGAWTPVSIGANNTFNVNLTGGAAQIVSATPNNRGGADIEVLYVTAAEAVGFANQACLNNPATKTVTGTVAGLAAGQQAVITLGSGSVTVNANGPFTITDASLGATDLIAVRQTPNNQTFVAPVDRIIVRRNVNPSAGGSIGATLDFGAAEAVAPASAAYTFTNVVTGEQILVTNQFQTSNGGSATFATLAGILGGFTNPLNVSGVPGSLLQSGDFNGISAFAFSETSFRGVTQFNRDIAARTISLGAPLATPTFTTLGTTPYARIRAAGTFQSDYGEFLNVTYDQANGLRNWSITATRNYFGAAGTFQLDVPDLTGVAGFQNSWGLQAGVLTDYTFNAYSGLLGVTTVTEGSAFRFGSISGQITP